MKNFETYCPVSGSSALQLKETSNSVRCSNIIAFPDREAIFAPDEVSHMMRCRALETEMMQSLRTQSVQGCAYNRIKPWEALVAGLVFSLVSVLMIL